MGRTLAGLAAVLALAGIGAGCGEGDGPSGPSTVRAAFGDLVADLSAGRASEACDSVTARAVAEVGWLIGDVAPATCVRRIRALDRDRASNRTDARRAWRVISVSVDGRRAYVLARYGPRWRMRVPFVWEADRWKAAAISGISGPPGALAGQS